MLKSGDGSVAAIFLLANFPGGETEAILKTLVEKTASRTNVSSKSNADEIKLAAEIVLANAGEENAVRNLSARAGGSDVETLRFLLTNIFEIESNDVLSSLSKTLDNKTYIAGGGRRPKLPKGGWSDPPPLRRLCDFAVNSFVERLNLKVNFKLHTTTYIEKQIAEARDLIKLQLKRS